MTTYTRAAVVAAAQAAIAEHSKGTAAGHCAACGQREPCPARNTAHDVLVSLGAPLPRRTPWHAGRHWLRR